MHILRKEKIGYVGFDNTDKLPFVIKNQSLSEDEISQLKINV